VRRARDARSMPSVKFKKNRIFFPLQYEKIRTRHSFILCVIGLESLSLTISDVRSIDFTYNRFMIKLFKTADMNIIKDCQAYFGTQLPSEM